MRKPGELSDGWQMVLALGAIVLLFAVCIFGPVLLGVYVGPWAALGGAVAAVVCWVYTVPPMPGFAQGLIALSGLAALLGQGIYWTVRVVQSLIA